MSKNARSVQATKNKNKVEMEIEIPHGTKEVLFFDKLNKNTLWANVIFKQMCGL
jgi:hypothetical protein